ncbi:MAG: MBL fold metallo-hydrolase [Lagierella massiliensis]|nr:MBL fold metallo-hydrolase [Lagierella massiliensis]
MKFTSLSSGSSGNSLLVETDKTRVLIDAGFTGKRLEKLITQAGILPDTIDAILVTHEHTDHVKGVGVMSRRYNIPIIANKETWIAMINKIGLIDDNNILVFKNDYDFTLKDLDIHPFSTFHDAANSCGFSIYNKKSKLSILTDTGTVNERIKKQIMGSDIFFIESNHDPIMLMNGPYSPSLKRRVASTKGHLSNLDCANTLEDVLTGNGEKVILAHLSNENNTTTLAYNTIYEHLKDLGLDLSRDISLNIADRNNVSNRIEL